MSKDKPCRGETFLEGRKQLPHHLTGGVVGGDTNNMEIYVSRSLRVSKKS